MTSRLRRPAGALLAGALTVGILGITPLAQAAVGGTISGTVTAPGGVGLENMGVAAYVYDDGSWLYTGQDWGYTSTDANGDYTLQPPRASTASAFRATRTTSPSTSTTLPRSRSRAP